MKAGGRLNAVREEEGPQGGANERNEDKEEANETEKKKIYIYILDSQRRLIGKRLTLF